MGAVKLFPYSIGPNNFIQVAVQNCTERFVASATIQAPQASFSRLEAFRRPYGHSADKLHAGLEGYKTKIHTHVPEGEAEVARVDELGVLVGFTGSSG